jgi:hypothetical protein
MIIFKWVFCICSIWTVFGNLSPFSSIKIVEDSIYFTIDSQREKWHKLFSINNIGVDAIVQYSKKHYGESKCDSEIECYKYNIIASFEDTVQGLMGKKFPPRVGVEYQEDNFMQAGIDLECTEEKYKLNQKYLEQNIKLSKIAKNTNTTIDTLISKGFNKIKKTIGNIFTTDKDPSAEQKSNLYSNLANNIRGEITELKKEIENLEKEEKQIKQVKLILRLEIKHSA